MHVVSKMWPTFTHLSVLLIYQCPAVLPGCSQNEAYSRILDKYSEQNMPVSTKQPSLNWEIYFCVLAAAEG